MRYFLGLIFKNYFNIIFNGHIIFSHLDKHIIGGTFGCINYADSRQSLSNLVRQISHFCFKCKLVTIQNRQNIPNTIEYSDWQENSRIHVEKFYKSHGKFLQPVIITPLLTNRWSKLINLDVIKTWCSSMSHDNPSLIIPNYNIMDHYGIFGISEELITSTLGIKHFPKNDNRLLVFNAAHSVLLIIRAAADATLEDEINHCINDVNLLLLLLRDLLKDSGLVVTGLVAYSGNKLHLKNKCHDCQHLITSKEVFASKEKFDKFWKNYIDEKVFRDMKEGLPVTDKRQLSMAILKMFLAYMAQYQVKVCKKPVLPMNKKDPAEAIGEAELLSDRYQLDIAYSAGKYTILKGDFGTGKTFICLKMIEFLASTLAEKEVLYFVSFHFKSELDCAVRKLVEGLHPNISIIKGNSDLSVIIEYEILKKEESNGTKKINLIVDEFNAESLVKEEARRLHELLKGKKQFKNATVLVAVHPMQMERVDFHHVFGEESGYLEKGNMFSELEDIMEVKYLQYVMRTTVENDLFIKITQEYLNEKSNHYIRCRDINNQKQKMRSNRKTELKDPMKPLHDFSLIEPIKTTEIEKVGDFLSFTEEPKFEPRLTFKGGQRKPQSNSLLNVLSTNFQSQQQNAIDFDELHKLTHTSNIGISEDYQRRVTTYRYFSFSTIGHTISGPRPNIVKLPSSASPSEFVGLFAIMFMVIRSENKRTALIHFEHDNPQWLEKLFRFSTVFKNLSITDDVRKFLSRSNENLILIRNYNWVRGLEFPNVIVILDEDEYHLKQFIPEAMARCIKNLSIIIKASKNEIEGHDTVMELLNHWEIINIERQETAIAKSLQFQFCSCISGFLCQQDALKGSGYYLLLSGNDAEACYQIHRKSKLYRQLLEEIKREVIPYMESDNRMKKNEAITL